MRISHRPFCLLAALAVAAFAAMAASAPVLAETLQPAAKAPCGAPSDLTRLAQPLPRTARKLAGGEPLKIVAIGSSSTAGAGASSPAMSYPSRLAVELKQLFPGREITVLNRGVNGEEAREMLARLEESVISEKPDLVLWQVGTNAVLRDHPLAPASTLIQDGLTRFRQIGADVILIDPQFAPKVIAKQDAEGMVKLIATAAKAANADVFNRFAVMRYWREKAAIPFETFISPDELHMNDWSYSCVAKLLAGSIAEAATRATVTATAIVR
jgi:acyl-CoA thioesterase I